MLDVDDRLESDLRSFLDAINAEPLPRQLAEFRPATVRSKKRVLHRFVGATGIAVVAAAVVLFAVELTGHPNNGSAAPGGQSAATPTPEPTPPFLPTVSPVHLPVGFSPPAGQVIFQGPQPPWLIPTTYGSGTETLPTVTLPPNEGIGIEYGCTPITSKALDTIAISGPGLPAVFGPVFHLSFDQDPSANSCSGGITTAGGTGGPITVQVSAPPSVRWVIRFYEVPSKAQVIPTPASSVAPTSSSGSPPYLSEGPAPPGAKVLIPVTYGTGPMTLPSFTASPTDNISIELGCLSTSAAVTTVTVNAYNPGFAGDTLVGQCFGGTGGSGGGGTTDLGGTVTMKIQAAPTEKWVILVYVGTGEGP